MRVTVVYMGGSRVQAGCERETVDFPDGTTVAQAAAQIVSRHPALAPWMSTVRWARNFQFARSEDALSDGDELALLPPVAGGAPSAILTTEPLDPEAVRAEVAGPDIGATVLFVGTVREQARGKQVRRLEYEAYEPMATRELERVCAAASAPYPGARVAIAHRHGKLEVGEVSVVIAAAAPHRADAFAACRDAIERIKVDVPIWKKEIAMDGETFVGWGGG
jgi:MoaE-MoaD fusion protein